MHSVEHQEERLRLAMINSDVAELDVLLSPRLSFTTFLGQTITKEQDLEAHRSGAFKIHAITLSEQQARAEGDCQITTCLAEIDATFDDDRTQKEFRFLRVWAKGEQGELQVVAGQATLVFESIDF